MNAGLPAVLGSLTLVMFLWFGYPALRKSMVSWSTNCRACCVRSSLICWFLDVCWVRLMDLNTEAMMMVMTAITTIISTSEKPRLRDGYERSRADASLTGVLPLLCRFGLVASHISPHVYRNRERESRGQAAYGTRANCDQVSSRIRNLGDVPAHVIRELRFPAGITLDVVHGVICRDRVLRLRKVNANLVT